MPVPIRFDCVVDLFIISDVLLIAFTLYDIKVFVISIGFGLFIVVVVINFIGPAPVAGCSNDGADVKLDDKRSI
ncbi:unnamed protein product [Schistosoma curassoni]|uniref:Transmembrane protein n=1 Tax=Schistosoma curassoni TaxID=6186 RepID=A0A183K6N6_9TREM|nr:unnamed protein product [Schistosoma curassoni]